MRKLLLSNGWKRLSGMSILDEGKGEKTFSGSDESGFATASTSVGDPPLVWILRYYE